MSVKTSEKVSFLNVLTADDEEPELSPLCITRTLHLTLTFLCLTPNWVQMRTMAAAGTEFLFGAVSRCPVALVLNPLGCRLVLSEFSSALR